MAVSRADDAARWDAWKRANLGTPYEIWHDGLPVEAVSGRRGAAREEALEMLRLGLSLGDSHAAAALAAMGESAAAGAMRAQLAAATGPERMRLALAIHQVRPDPTLAAELVAVLRGGYPWSVRIDAAIGLRRFAGATDEAALLAAVADPEYLVRYHACESLLVRWGVRPAEISKHADIFPRICGPQDGAPTGDDLARYAEARARLEALARRPAAR